MKVAVRTLAQDAAAVWLFDLPNLVITRAGITGVGQNAAGLSFDLLLNTPVGLSALTYCLVGYLVGTFQSSVLRSTWWIPVVGTIVASAIGVLLFAVLDEVVGQATVDVDRLPGIVAYVAILNGVLSRPFRWVLRRALADPSSSSRDRLFLR